MIANHSQEKLIYDERIREAREKQVRLTGVISSNEIHIKELVTKLEKIQEQLEESVCSFGAFKQTYALEIEGLAKSATAKEAELELVKQVTFQLTYRIPKNTGKSWRKAWS